MPTDYLTPAIEAVKQLVIDLLVNNKFCDAKRAGRALEELLPLRNEKLSITPLPELGGMTTICETSSNR